MPSPYTIPRYGTPNIDLLPWLLSAVAQGNAWLQSQRPQAGWQQVAEALGPDINTALDDQSNVTFKKSKRIVRELVASLTNFRYEGEMVPRWDRELYDQAKILTDLDKNWHDDCGAAASTRSVLQYGLAQGTGYWYCTWDPHFHGAHMGDIRQRAVAPEDVTFVQLPKDHDIQSAYGVIIRETLPLNLAQQIYSRVNPGFAERLVADTGGQSWIQKGLQRVQQFVAPALRVAGKTQPDTAPGFPTVDIYHAYFRDDSVNDTPEPVDMGAMGTNWHYRVPNLGSPIDLPQINPETGRPFTRPALASDCRMFPLRRLVVFASTGVCYDGSSPWWHGQAPLARVRFGDWAWEALGESVLNDLLPLETGMVALMRMMEDVMAARLDPAALYDDQLASRGFAEAFNPRKAGARAAAQLNMGKVIEFPVPPEFLNIPPGIPEYIDRLGTYMDYVSGVTDMVAIAKAKQVPGADTLEKLLEMAGPIVQDMVGALEEPLRQLGEWRKAYYFQFYTGPRVIQTVGDDGVEVGWQYTPDKLLNYIANELPHQTTARGIQSVRAFKYKITESGLNEIHRMTNRLFYIQLMAKGFPISWWTMADVAKIPNFGPPPEGTNNEMERYVAQLRIQAELQAEIAQSMAPPGALPGAPGGGGAPGGPPKPGQSGPGRPNANTAPPKIESKDGGTRSTITTSE